MEMSKNQLKYIEKFSISSSQIVVLGKTVHRDKKKNNEQVEDTRKNIAIL